MPTSRVVGTAMDCVCLHARRFAYFTPAPRTVSLAHMSVRRLRGRSTACWPAWRLHLVPAPRPRCLNWHADRSQSASDQGIRPLIDRRRSPRGRDVAAHAETMMPSRGRWLCVSGACM